MTEASTFRILVVDDDPISQVVATGHLKALGQVAETASDGDTAVQMVEGADYDLILMDMQMPDSSGLEITQRIRAIGNRGAAPRIYSMTATAINNDLELCRQAGMNGHLTKPITREKLVDLLGRLQR